MKFTRLLNRSSRSKSTIESPTGKEYLQSNLKQNIQRVKEALGNSSDIIFREVSLSPSGAQVMGLLYTDGLADQKIINDFVAESVMMDLTDQPQNPLSPSDMFQRLKDFALTIGGIKEFTDFDTLYNSILSGEAVILLDEYDKGVAVSVQGWKDRGVNEPSTESVVRGPHEGFSETLRTNTALVRRKIKDPNLWLESRQIGRVTKTEVAIMFIKGVASDEVIEEVRVRLDRIDIDGILESGYIEELIQDETYTPFPTIKNSERPDVIAAELLEGKVAILVDGTPFVLVVPALFVSFIHAAEDYYQRADISTLVRILRYIGIFITLLFPSLYIAITTFHQEMLPTPLVLGLAAQREGVPIPAFIEALMMEVAFEVLREAGLRMPRVIGPAVSVVGTLVIGQAAVEAGIVSAAMVIVVAVTAISSFIFPSYNMSNTFRMLRLPMMGLAASFGLFGIFVGVIAILLHLCSLRSFGVPYMSPFAPMIALDQKDAIFRFPRWAMFSRPRLISQKNVTRGQKSPSQKPEPRK
ncbi:spore germination protein [Bacillus sp. 3255]|uniref:spore germination protein n=1 Tax=Bacillus sp. 3255 TaxID=2817904 RepID=UPI00286564EF|nr:spore germination protein [Bacillus sp. 3255]MDR6882465.1 spore germination protein KA [Bacillus sp. 3255]